jgi:ABC-type molybdenum transport system ATPase subunit/photorepair protein PhrA
MSSSAALKSLTLTAFRGSTATFKLEFEKGRKLTLIYGENGSGKTTICDAFEFLASERIGSLEDRGMGKGLERFWPAAGRAASALTVDLETTATQCSGRIVNKEIVVSPSSSRPHIELLRQRQILELIQAQPAKRYETIKRFINIEEIEQSEDSLRQLRKALTNDRELAQAAEHENLATLQSFYEAAGKPARLNAVDWAMQKLAEPATNLDAAISALAELRAAFAALKSGHDKLAARRGAVAAAETIAEAADQDRLSALSEAGDGAADLLAVLSAGGAYIKAHPDASACPLCESAENISGLCAAVESKLLQLRTLEDMTSKWKQAHEALNSANAALKQEEIECRSAATILINARTAHPWKTDVVLPATPAPAELAALPEWLIANEATASDWADVEARWRDESRSLEQLRSATERYTINATRVAELTGLIPKVDDALSQFVEERQKFTDSIISDIAKEVGRLYEKVHPGEGLEKIALELDSARRASLKLGATFAGHDAPPQAYFSQSHLDTLGLCIFLALALRDRPAGTVLILDDVLGSVDEPHVERVIDMIYEVSAAFQHTIVTTHYRPWREKYQWGWLKPDQACQFIELTSWTMEDGIRIINAVPEIERLRKLLAESPIDPQAVCSKAGVILEAVLDYLTQKYECAVPRRRGAAYTLGDLLPAISNKLRDALKIEIRDGVTDPAAPPSKTVELKPILDELARIAQTRNAHGAHFKTISFELLDADAIGFAKHVVMLADAVICPVHGWPSNDKSGSYWRNSGDTRRLHPLKKPA